MSSAMRAISRPGTRSLSRLSARARTPGVSGSVTGLRCASTGVANTDALKKERIVILGSGWAGFTLGRSLGSSRRDTVMISPRSHFVFTPLLASTTVGTIEFRSVLEPVRGLGLAEVHQAWASDIDFARKTVRVESNTAGNDVAARTGVPPEAKGDEFDVPYDKLVLSVGCYSQTFGIEGVKEHACLLRDVGDARSIRLRVLAAFERAELPTTGDDERRKLLHFAVVGGGPTGIEFAAELHDLVHDDLSRLYPALMRFVAITIYDIAPKVLPMFDQNLAAYATDMFRRQGIQVKTEHHLTRIRREGDTLLLSIKEEQGEIGAGVVVWSTGLMQNPLVGRLTGREVEGAGTIAKDPKTGGFVTDDRLRLQVEGPDGSTRPLPDVYAMGDCAVVQGQKLPATAQVAGQQAKYLGKELGRRRLADGEGKAFSFSNWGTLAYVGSSRAIHQSSADELKGRAAWLLWRTAYLTKSMSVRNKMLIPVYWLITRIFGRDISRF